jgi:hypothetical protein
MENDYTTSQQVAVRLLSIGLPNVEANIQKPDGWSKQEPVE